ncbi:Innexin [Caenorhabditis elegans]|uniref:Innexin n=1 Tax=Caenorhabditis elegans TaxID=6239 RepID=Q9N3R5_CAEEL|nr:Innexin [Caenorhabditis elegans]CCD72547.1 Innexin [Caenorhabditis elegans]|eukprot:NP_491186.2 Innexin [Caenorhabditis elegans]
MGFSAIDKLIRPFLQLHEWDNGAERIVHTTTIQILICFGFLVSSNMMFGQPITCLMLPETPDSSANYFHDFCFYQDKLRIPPLHNAVKRSTRQGTMNINNIMPQEVAVTYYQWTPFIIFLQVAMCLVPALMWKFFGLHYFYGHDFAAIVRSLASKKKDDKMDSSNSNYEVDARETLRWLEHKKRERFGMHTTMMIYVAMKWMTFASLLFQFNLMAKIYASGELLWGVHISYELLNGAYKNVYTGVFPQIVGCNPHRAQLGGVVNEFIMRCILPQNFVNSKVFLFLYWWYILAMLVSIYSAVQFTAMLFLPKYQRYATKSLLPTEEFFNEHAEKPTKGSLEFFVDYMGNDGYLLLQCASVPLSVVRIRFFLNSLYTIVVEKKKEYEDQKPMVPRKQKTPIDHIQFDGPDRSGTKGPYKNGKAMIMSDGDSYTKQLLSHSSPSCSPASSQRYSAAPGKNLEDYE